MQGACLTVTKTAAAQFECDCLEETLQRTCLTEKKPGDAMNLERALRGTDRMGGHFVTAHVDGVGRVRGIERTGRDIILEIACTSDVLDGIVAKGSIACDGVSLTVVDRTNAAFTVHLIPTTWEQTSLSSLQVGSPVNLETDMIGKYVYAFLRAREGNAAGLTVEDLRRAGFT